MSAGVTAEPTIALQCMEVWGGNQAADASVALPGLDAWVFSIPHRNDTGGGDIHFVSSCATGRIVRLVVADVSGHGLRVADLARTLRALLRRYVNQLDQDRFFGELNREFAAAVKIGTFATAVVATFWAPTGELVLCNAGHPRPLLWRAHRREWEFLDATMTEAGLVNAPLGMIEGTEYRDFGVVLATGDLVLLYTDALVEAVNDAGEFLGEDGLLDLLRRTDPTRPERVIGEVSAAVDVFRGGAEADDDATLLLFRSTGRGARLTLRDKLVGTRRMLETLAASMRRGAEPMPWPDFAPANMPGLWVPALQRLWHRAGRTRRRRVQR